LHYVQATIYKAEKALIAAKFNGLVLDKKPFDAKKDAQNPEFKAKNPTGKVPFLETDTGCICTSNSIARYVARCRSDTFLYGKGFDDEGKIDTWLEFCTHEIEVPLMVWVYPTMGVMQEIPKATSQAQADMKKALVELEKTLKSSSYLIGDYVSLADIALVCALKEGFVRVFDPAFRKPYPTVTAWFEGCCALPQFKAVFGGVKLCAQAEKPIPVKPEFAPPARKEEKPKPAAAPKQEAKKEKAPAPAPKATAAPAVSSASASDLEAKIKKVGDDVRELKEKLKAEGLSGKKINDDPGIVAKVAELKTLKDAMAAAPAAAPAAAAPAPAAAAPAASGDATAVGDQIRALKEKLKGEGLSGKKINDHAEVKALVQKLTELKAAGGAAPAAAPSAPAPAPTANGASGGDVEAQVKSVGDEIRTLKEKLKADGLSGKKINDHDEIKSLVAKLTELKTKM